MTTSSAGDRVAFVYKGDGMPAYHSPLARADFTRQRDIFKLARRGNADCRRLWDDFARECPADARLVVADVESGKAETAKVTEKLDKRLRKAEKSAMVTKNAKPKLSKAAKREIRSQPVSPEVRFDVQLSQWLASDNPAEREAAREALRARGVFR